MIVVAAALVLAWTRLSRKPWGDLGFRRPRSWAVTLAGGAVLGVALKFASKAIVMPLLGAPAVNMPYHYLAGNAAALAWMIAVIVVQGGVAEEVFFRGYLFDRLGVLLGTGAGALTATVLLTTALFAISHYADQGVPGVEQAVLTGLVFGGLFAWRQQIWLVMAAHVGYDLAAIALIYANWEEVVAHLVFRSY